MAIAIVVLSAGIAGAGPIGPVFQVNDYTTGTQRSPVAAADAAGNVTVVWVSDADAAQDGDGAGVIGRRIDADGVPLTAEFQVNTFTTGAQDLPAVASNGAGDFVVAWESDGQDGDGLGVFGQRFDASGTPQGSEFQVNVQMTGAQHDPAVAIDADGAFVVAWTDDGQDGDGSGVFARRYDAAGGPLGGEFQVNTYTTNDQNAPSVAIGPDGDFLVTWSSFEQAFTYAAETGVYAQGFDADGVPMGAEFQVLDGAFFQDDSIALADDDGTFLVTFRDHNTSSPFGYVRARRCQLTGPLGSYFEVAIEGVRHAAALDAAGNAIMRGTDVKGLRWIAHPRAELSAAFDSTLPSFGYPALAAFGDGEVLEFGAPLFGPGDILGQRYTACNDPSFGPPCSDHPIDAKRGSVDSNKRVLKFVSKDPSYPFPAIDGPDDPRAVGMTVWLITPTEKHSIYLDPHNNYWVPKAGTVERFKIRLPFSSPTIVVMKAGRALKLKLSTPYDAIPPFGTLGVRIQFGNTRTCAFFDATTVRGDADGRFLAVGALGAGVPDCTDASLGGL